MPRNLTDLMESAVSAAPPENHHASDITRLAERRQRRRTTFVAGVAALALVAVAGGTFGLTRGHSTTPEPTAPYKYGQELDVNDAVPVSSLPGFRMLPWTQPSLQPLSEASNRVPTYTGVDASGRLLVTELRRQRRRAGARDGPALRRPRATGATAAGARLAHQWRERGSLGSPATGGCCGPRPACRVPRRA